MGRGSAVAGRGTQEGGAAQNLKTGTAEEAPKWG